MPLGVKPLVERSGPDTNVSRLQTIEQADRLLWSQFDVIGFTERFDATLLLFDAMLLL